MVNNIPDFLLKNRKKIIKKNVNIYKGYNNNAVFSVNKE